MIKKPFNPYDVLGVSRKSGKTEIKRQFRKKAKEMHPDRGGNKDDFTILSRAYALLADDRRRKIYDETGATEHDPNSRLWMILCRHFLDIIRDNDLQALRNHDILNKLKILCNEDERSINTNIKKAEKELKKLREVKMRLKSYNGSNNPLHFMLDDNISKFSNQILNMEKQKEGIQGAIRALDRFKYEFDGDAESFPISFISNWGRMGTTSTTSGTEC